MGEYTFKEILLWIFASIGGVAGLVKAFTAISDRFDKRKTRKKAESLLATTASADIRRVKLEEERLDEGVWEAVAKEKQSQISELKDDVQTLKVKIHDGKQIFDELETMFRRLRVAKIPDEVVDILSEKINRATETIQKGRDALS